MIALDIGVLAIQSVDAAPNTSRIKICLYFSVVACLGSIISSLLLQSKNDEMIGVSYSEAVCAIADSQCHLTSFFLHSAK